MVFIFSDSTAFRNAGSISLPATSALEQAKLTASWLSQSIFDCPVGMNDFVITAFDILSSSAEEYMPAQPANPTAIATDPNNVNFFIVLPPFIA